MDNHFIPSIPEGDFPQVISKLSDKQYEDLISKIYNYEFCISSYHTFNSSPSQAFQAVQLADGTLQSEDISKCMTLDMQKLREYAL